MATVGVMREESRQQAILFMQKEHADTLRGLHAEIAKLQKRCSELTFQLAMETTSCSQEDILQEKLAEAEERLDITTSKLQLKEKELIERDKRISDLELMLKAQEKNNRDKIIYLNSVIKKYKRQAEDSACQNVEMLMEARQQNQRRGSSEAKVHEANSKHTTHTSSAMLALETDKDSVMLHPHAPIEPKNPRTRSRRVRSSLDYSAVSLTSPSGRKMSTDLESDENKLDPRPFLRLGQDSKSVSTGTVLPKKETKPLPPISRSSTEMDAVVEPQLSPREPTHHSRSDLNPSNLPHPNKVDSANFKKLKIHQKSKSKHNIEMETLALDVSHSDPQSVRKAQEFSSYKQSGD